MNLLYCGDKGIDDGLALSVLSVLKHHEEPLHIYVLTMSLCTQEKQYRPVSGEIIDHLNQTLKEKNAESSIRAIDITEYFQKELPIRNLGTRFTPYCMLRLFADCLPEIPERILYLDTDVLCRGNLKEFYEMDLTGKEFAGVLDYYGSWFFRKKFYRRDYMNSGVLLLNMTEIRRTGLFTNCRRLIVDKKMFMPDQSALNHLATAKVIVPRRFNDQRCLHEDTVLQHFSTTFRFFPRIKVVTVKPWEFDKVHEVLKLHEYDELFDYYNNWKEVSEKRKSK